MREASFRALPYTRPHVYRVPTMSRLPHSELQCTVVCCSVLQCVAVCCNLLRCVAVCRSVLQCVAICCSVLQRLAVCCSVLQCVAVCCNVQTDPPHMREGSFTPVARLNLLPEKVTDFSNFSQNWLFSTSVLLCSFLWSVEWIHEGYHEGLRETPSYHEGLPEVQ